MNILSQHTSYLFHNSVSLMSSRKVNTQETKARASEPFLPREAGLSGMPIGREIVGFNMHFDIICENMGIHEQLTIIRRPEYTLGNLNRVFVVLETFGIETKPQDKLIYDQLFCGIDFVDQMIDTQGHGDNIANHILSYLVDSSDSLPQRTPENVKENLSFLRGIIREKGIELQVEETTLKLLSLHSKLSEAKTNEDYIQSTRLEAVESAKLALLFGPEDLPRKVNKFLTQANVLGNFADNLLDLDSDYQEGKILITPTPELKCALKLQIAKQLAILSWYYPQKQKLPELARRYINMLGKNV